MAALQLTLAGRPASVGQLSVVGLGAQLRSEEAANVWLRAEWAAI